MRYILALNAFLVEVKKFIAWLSGEQYTKNKMGRAGN